QRGEQWGGPGAGAIQVSAVRSVPGVPLPRPRVVTQNRSSDVPAVHEAQPEPAPPTRPQAVELPRLGQPTQRPRPPRRREPERPVVTPPGAIPSSGGGPAPLPYTSFQLRGGEAGLALGAGGAFGNRYSWYVDSVRRRISSNWLVSTVDAYVQWAPRAVISFEILRDGTVVNIQTLRSSGVPSVDRSALRAVRESSPLDRLPSDYTGGKVAVEFWFDFRRQ
ncbi:MAG: energy transducer TonB, partial [Terriglobia bacterium]